MAQLAALDPQDPVKARDLGRPSEEAVMNADQLDEADRLVSEAEQVEFRSRRTAALSNWQERPKPLPTNVC